MPVVQRTPYHKGTGQVEHLVLVAQWIERNIADVEVGSSTLPEDTELEACPVFAKHNMGFDSSRAYITEECKSGLFGRFRKPSGS